jgi:hypothetical protein
MKKVFFIVFSASLFSFSFQNSKTIATYQRYYANEPAHGEIFLKKDGTYATLLQGGCDGRIESRGKWKINKDTLHFTEVEGRILNDPWKKTDGELKFIIKKNKLISFSWVDNKMLIDSTEYYKKVKTKQAKVYE